MRKEDLNALQINKVIVHDVPKYNKADTNRIVDYSQRISRLNAGLKSFLLDKIIFGISNTKSYRVLFDESTRSPVPKIIQVLFTTGDDFVSNTQLVAKHLCDIQSGNNPAGIVVIIEGTIESSRVATILKLERDEGTRIRKDLSTQSIDIETVKDLMLTKKTKLYKIATFFNRLNYATDFDGFVNDAQVFYQRHSVIARFFLEDFLGCKIHGDNSKKTQEFFEHTKEFILKKIIDPVNRTEYFGHLLSYVNKFDPIIDPGNFCESYFHPSDRGAYKSYLNEERFDIIAFEKDNDIIKGQIKKMVIEFESGLLIIAPGGEIQQHIQINSAERDMIKAEIVGRLKSLKS